jgi:hypothetical protein
MNLATSLAAPDPTPAKLALAPNPTRVYLPTASKTDHLFACTWPFGRVVPREDVGERTRFGSAFHQVMEAKVRDSNRRPLIFKAAAAEWDVDIDELEERVGEALPIIQAWLKGGNQWDLDFTKGQMHLEVSVGFSPGTGEARVLPDGPGPDHDYPGRLDGEIPGTADLASVLTVGKGRGQIKNGRQYGRQSLPTKYLLVLDYKSGWNVSAGWQPQTPAESGQLLTLASALAKIHGITNIIVAFFHARRDSTPIVLADMVTATDLAAHRRELIAAMANVGSEWMRPGPWCSTCPGRSICPTRTTSLTTLGKPPGPMTSTRLGVIHQTLAEWRKLEEDLVAEMTAWVKANGPGQRPDGQIVDLVERSRSNLSMASIVRAYGPLKGKALIEKLRKEGAIETLSHLELRAVPR